MRTKIEEKIEIPEKVTCIYENRILTCKSSAKELSRKIYSPEIEISIKGNTIFLLAKKANKNQKKIIFTFLKHINNLFIGLAKKYTYQLEAANVHFPMTIKTEEGKMKITNFLGEKTPRTAKILPGVEVEIKGQNIIITSHDKEAAGQTAANLEKAVRVNNRDRRIFQDGIYITRKPGEEE